MTRDNPRDLSVFLGGNSQALSRLFMDLIDENAVLPHQLHVHHFHLNSRHTNTSASVMIFASSLSAFAKLPILRLFLFNELRRGAYLLLGLLFLSRCFLYSLLSFTNIFHGRLMEDDEIY